MPRTIQEMFNELPKHFDPEAWGSKNAVMMFDVKGEQGGSWVATIEDKQLDFRKGTVENPDMTLIAQDEDLLKMVNGDLNPVTAFMSGKVKIQGDMSLAMKLQGLLSAAR